MNKINYVFKIVPLLKSPWIKAFLLFSLWLGTGGVTYAGLVENDVQLGSEEITSTKPISQDKLRVVTKPFEPFVIPKGDGQYSGFSIAFWEEIAKRMGYEYELYSVNSISDLIIEIKNNRAAVGIAGISRTFERKKEIDFSYSFFEAGLQIMVPVQSDSAVSTIISEVIALLSFDVFKAIGLLILIMLIAAHIIWLVERQRNPDFAPTYLKGIGDAIWWTAVTVTTVGYGDKSPTGLFGRIFGIIWMFLGLFIVATFTATVTTALTVNKLGGIIQGPDDLFGKTVATVSDSTAEKYLIDHIGKKKVRRFPDIQEAYQVLQDGKVDAIVYDAPVLQYYASHQEKGLVKVVGAVFNREYYAIALPNGSPLKENINMILLEFMEERKYQELRQEWFGSK